MFNGAIFGNDTNIVSLLSEIEECFKKSIQMYSIRDNGIMSDQNNELKELTSCFRKKADALLFTYSGTIMAMSQRRRRVLKEKLKIFTTDSVNAFSLNWGICQLRNSNYDRASFDKKVEDYSNGLREILQQSFTHSIMRNIYNAFLQKFDLKNSINRIIKKPGGEPKGGILEVKL